MASNNAVEARMSVPQRLPDSRVTVEKRAAAKARTKPTIATRNRTHTSGTSRCGNRERSGAESRGSRTGFRTSCMEGVVDSSLAPATKKDQYYLRRRRLRISWFSLRPLRGPLRPWRLKALRSCGNSKALNRKGRKVQASINERASCRGERDGAT